MSDFPERWARARLQDVCELINGRAYKQDELLERGKYPVLRVGNFFSNRNWYYSNLDLDSEKYCDSGDLLYAWSASFGPRIWDGGKVIFHYHIWKTRLVDALIEKRFLYHWFEWDKENIKSDHGTGSTMIHVTKGDMEAREFALPPPPEQRRIVAKIDSLTGKSRRARDHLDHIPRLVEKYKQAILAAAFRGDLCIKRRSPKLLPLSEFIVSLDQGWSPKCASEPADSNDWGVIKTTAIQSIQFLPQENKRLPADLTPRLEIVINAGDVLITRAGPRNRVAISCLVTENHSKLMLCDKAYRIRINPEMADPAFVTYMLNTPQCLSELEVMKTGISDSGLNLTQGKFIALEIPAFSLPEQSEIIRRIRSAFMWIDRLAADATSARELIDHLDQSVLVKAFKGELVPQDPSDEPASVVLERIRAERAAAPKAKRGRKKIA